MEHRWGQRREVSRAVHLRTRGGLVARGRLVNVSLSGAFIVSPLPGTVSSHIEVRFTTVVAGRRATLSVVAEIVRKDVSGFAVEWPEFACQAARALLLERPARNAVPVEHGELGSKLAAR